VATANDGTLTAIISFSQTWGLRSVSLANIPSTSGEMGSRSYRLKFSEIEAAIEAADSDQSVKHLMLPGETCAPTYQTRDTVGADGQTITQRYYVCWVWYKDDIWGRWQ
jgi:hypothetical protein